MGGQDSKPQTDTRRQVEERLRTQASGPFVWRAISRGIGGELWRVQAEDCAWCVKAAAGDAERLLAESDGLEALAVCGKLRVPRVLATAQPDEGSWLLMEWLDFTAPTPHAAAQFGTRLVAQHRCRGRQFGWRRDNFIGATPQFNALNDDWLEFFRERRLGFQLRLAAENGYRGALQEQGARLMESLPRFFAGYTPTPALLHGDLWSGNWGVLGSGEPVVFDPAVYYGDREADLAMTELFGGFPPEFYAAYNAAWPLAPGYQRRRDLYNLYHVLNHLNLFGGGYLSRADTLLSKLNVRTK